MIPLQLDRASATPLATQIAAGLRATVAAGGLVAGQPVPSTRALASQLSVARGTVVAAYDQLVSEGYLVATPGGTTRIHPDARSTHQQGPGAEAVTGHPAARAPRPRLTVDLTPGTRASGHIDDPAWRESWRKAAAEPPVEADRDRQGLPQLRAAIAEHLRLLRATHVDPNDIVVTSGARGGLTLTLATLGIESVAVESPGYPGLRRVLERQTVQVVEAPVDADGLVIDALPSATEAILVTPNHLYPAGSIMPAARRIDLLRTASANGQLVIEDDFDNDYRHLGAPVPTLWDLDRQSVLHLGTFSQVLAASAGVGYVIAPPALRSALADTRSDLGAGPPIIAQRAVASFLASGGLRRHITRRRRELLRRRNVLTEGLAEFSPQMVSGAHALIRVATAEQAREVQAACATQQIGVGRLNQYWSSGEDAQRVHGILLQFAGANVRSLQAAIEPMRAALRAHTS